MEEMDSRFKSLVSGCHLATEEDLYDSSQGGSEAVFVLSVLKSKELEVIGNISLESCSHIFGGTRRIEDPVCMIDT